MNGSNVVKRKRLRLAALGGALVCAVALLVLSDMAVGSQRLSFVLGGHALGTKSNDISPDYYHDDGGLAIGKWHVIRPPLKMKDVGYAVYREESLSIPVLYQQVFHRNGALSRDVKAFDSEGNEVPLYPPDTDSSELKVLEPFPLFVVYDYDEDGNLVAEGRHVYGVLDSQA